MSATTMRVMRLERPRAELRLAEVELAPLGEHQVRLRVRACAVCRTDLHVVDGELPRPCGGSLPHAKLPLVPGHEIVGEVIERGARTGRFAIGDRVGVPWLAWTCGACAFCAKGRENLCERARFTGYDVDGGFAELAAADERYGFALPREYSDVEAAPLLCAGLIGHRALRAAGEASRIGLYGFGAAAHIVAQVARYEGRSVYAFTRDGDLDAQAHARELGAVWTGGSSDPSPEPLDAAILFAPVGALVPAALRAIVKGGVVVCAGIHMSDVPSFPYSILWGERSVRSVANLTRADGEEFLALAPRVPVRTSVETFALSRANEALALLRAGRVRGAAVLVPDPLHA